MALVHPAGAHPEPVPVVAGAGVPIRETADAEEAHHVPEVLLGEQLVDRPRGGQQVQLGEPLAGPMNRLRVLVAMPQLGRQVRRELVVDDQP